MAPSLIETNLAFYSDLIFSKGMVASGVLFWLAFAMFLTTQTSMPPVGFEPTISAGEWPKTYTLDRAVTGTGTKQLFSSEKTFNLYLEVAHFKIWTKNISVFFFQDHQRYADTIPQITLQSLCSISKFVIVKFMKLCEADQVCF